MSSDGELTAKIGMALENWPRLSGYKVLFDHGPKDKANVGTIVSWFGAGAVPARETELSQLDIAIVKPGGKHDRALVLLEVEETSARPKTLLGDALGFLAGDHVSFEGQELEVGPWTTLVVLAQGAQNQEDRVARLLANVRACVPALDTRNSKVGAVHMRLFSNADSLESLSKQLIDEALTRGGS
jgi:hypothetical protein